MEKVVKVGDYLIDKDLIIALKYMAQEWIKTHNDEKQDEAS